MADIIDFESLKPDGYGSGKCRCIACGHEWAGVSELPLTGNLVCPSCGLERGQFVYPFGPLEGSVIYQCSCGSEVFYIVSEHALAEDIPLLNTSSGRSHRSACYCVGCGATRSL